MTTHTPSLRAYTRPRPSLLVRLRYEVRALAGWRQARIYRHTCGRDSFTAEEIRAAAALVTP